MEQKKGEVVMEQKKGEVAMEQNEAKNNAFDLEKAVEEFTKCAQRTILPFNQVAYETILGVLELALIREAVSHKIAHATGVKSEQIIDYTKPPVEKLDEHVFGIIDEVNAELGEAGDKE